ncbi:MULTISPECIES: hypothetical protein [Micrococcales]|uniref:Uncharacterized protein n=2 Tax=Micrococcales TaxID=85006 RepID=A0A2N7S110_9MICC|nr:MULTISPECIES: hypothetical protein [Micrococcales]MDN5811472.1 hypothetical protein [Micrococcaceae bacterium]PCC18343.1 hypothetical protein CIK79_08600 [Brevibacterium aurantiacum]PMQ19793.1 hypothetical protein CIK84_14240 [Glutamicibacter arilaitensis]
MNHHRHTQKPHPPVPDFTTGEGLRELLIELNEHNAWATSPVAAELMVYATQKYTPIAKAWRREPADAAYEAFVAMRQRTTLRADDPWAVITRAVALGIAAEVHADRNMTSQDKARRPSKRPSEEPMRAGHYEEFFYDVHPHAHSLYARHDGGEDHSADRVIRATCVFLVLTDWPARPVEQAVDYIAHRVTGLSSRDSAVEIVSKERHIAIRLGYGPDEWAALVRLVIGTKTGKRKTGQYGLFARVLLGDDVADLLRDDDLVETSRRSACASDGQNGGPLP